MEFKWDQKVSQAVTKKYETIREELGEGKIEDDRLTACLLKLHPETTKEEHEQSIREIRAGIHEIFSLDEEKLLSTSTEILKQQMQELETEEEKKGFLCQMFDSIKESDKKAHSEIKDVPVQSPDIAQMPLEELEKLVAEQLSNSVSSLSYETLRNNMEDPSQWDLIPVKTQENALLLAVAQYSAALDEDVPAEYAKVPKLLGQCAAAQARIGSYCERVMQTPLAEDKKAEKIARFIEGILTALCAGVFVGMASFFTASLMVGVTDAIAAVFGNGIVWAVLSVLSIYPVVGVALLATAAVFLLTYAVSVGIRELLCRAASKVKEFYERLVEWAKGKGFDWWKEDAQEDESEDSEEDATEEESDAEESDKDENEEDAGEEGEELAPSFA